MKSHGIVWFIKRTLREMLQPITLLGKCLKPIGFMLYTLFCRPFNAIVHRHSKNQHKSADSLYFFYDLEVEPITYNFCWALAIAEARRKEQQLSQLKIIFVPGLNNGLRKEAPDYQAIVDDNARWWRIYNALLPLINLLPTRASIHFCTSRQEALSIIPTKIEHIYPDKYSVTFPTTHWPADAMHYSTSFMCFRATPESRAYVNGWLAQRLSHRKLIVITLRQYDYTPERNSNMDAWAAFANSLDKNEFFVIIVPDAEQAFKDLPPSLQHFTKFEAACWNVMIRAALYELAYLNLGVNNGPMLLCWLNPHCRYITFKMTLEGSSAASPKNMAKYGYPLHQEPPFVNSFQKWIWEKDDIENITREFYAMYQRLENKNIQYHHQKTVAV